MRLIDADKLYNWIKTECNQYGNPTIDFESGCRMLDIIKRMPTAFDKENVIEEIRERVGDCYLEYCGKYASCQQCRADEAIKIVKKCGID